MKNKYVTLCFGLIYVHQGSNNGVEKRKWSSSVRSYLCGDEHNSVLAAEDSNLGSFRSNIARNSTSQCGYDISCVYAEDVNSVRSSEATVTQPLHIEKEKQNSAYKLFQQEDAALIIQSAFRSFLVNSCF